MVVRSDAKLEAIGQIAELPPDTSPLQIGTSGRFRDRAFTLQGRLRVTWDEGSWTEWYAEFSNGERGWIAETQGFFTVSFERGVIDEIKSLAGIRPSSAVEIGGKSWQAIDRKTAIFAAAEGELPFVAKPGTERDSLDLSGPENAFASLEKDGADIIFYEGAYAEFAELNFENLRAVPGWSDTPLPVTRRASRVVNCPNCGAPVDIRAAGLTLAVVCGSCQTILDPARADVAVIERAEEVRREFDPVLAMGIRGDFDGTTFEVIGALIRSDGESSWHEYLLFNPWQGFRWLVFYSGHWTFVRRLFTPPIQSSERRLKIGHESYLLFARSDTTVKAVLGEFYWQIHRGEESAVADFISPPKIISGETYPGLDEVTWSIGTYISADRVQRAFKLPTPLPDPSGPYLNAPNPYAEKWPGVLTSAIFAVLFLVAVELFFARFHSRRLLTSANFAVPLAPAPSGTGPSTLTPVATPSAPVNIAPENFTTPHFTLSGPSQIVRVTAWSRLNNSWIDLDYELVNATTGATLPEKASLSYYSGYDTDGRWTEDQRVATTSFPAVPRGEYFLRVEGSKDPKLMAAEVALKVESGGIFVSNFFLMLGLISIYPCWVFSRRVQFETTRWSQSDFSPFTSST